MEKSFIAGVKSEFGKIIAPSKKRVVANTGMIIAASVVFSALIVGMDTIFQNIINLFV